MRKETTQFRNFLKNNEAYSANINTERLNKICQEMEEKPSFFDYLRYRMVEINNIEHHAFIAFIERELLPSIISSKDRRISGLKFHLEETRENVKSKLSHWTNLLTKN